METAEQVVLTFNEDVNPDFVAVKVSGPEGSETAGKPDGRRHGSDPGAGPRPAGRKAHGDLPRGQHRRSPGVGDGDVHDHGGPGIRLTVGHRDGDPHTVTDRLRRGLAGADRDRRPRLGQLRWRTRTPWLVVAVVTLLAVLGLGAAWRTIGGRRPTPSADAADAGDERAPGGLTDFARTPGGC